MMRNLWAAVPVGCLGELGSAPMTFQYFSPSLSVSTKANQESSLLSSFVIFSSVLAVTLLFWILPSILAERSSVPEIRTVGAASLLSSSVAISTGDSSSKE